MSKEEKPATGARLRPWTDSDADIDAVITAFEADDMAAQAAEPINGENAARRWLAPWLEPDSSHVVAFAIDCGGTAFGHVMAGAIDRRHQTAWISYWVSPRGRGKGLASAALATLAEHCFGTLGLHRLELAHRTNNPASGRVALTAGFLVEGLEREKLMYLNEMGEPVRFDVQTLARLRTDPAPKITALQIVNVPV
ncbi:MAG: GNAT family N-acetyltransferase [Paeniglutamicibacter terrestris]